MDISKYDHKRIEEKWQNIWHFETNETHTGEKFYMLEMLPYPSGKMHMGHVRNYTLGDVVARFKTMHGYNVLHPMGWDAFGLPAENAARQYGVDPASWTENNIAEMKAEMKRCGFSYDWSRELKTCDPDYYKHEQEFFIKFYEAGLIYQKESLVNWDPVDNTVLANEQVINGRGWRSGAIVEKKRMKQWFCRTTAYAEELLRDLEVLERWPDSVKTMQYNWIGRSEGALIKFKVVNSSDEIEVYTTRPDTIFGCSFIGIAYDHNILSIVDKTLEIEAFIRECTADSVAEAVIETKEKRGVFTGLYVNHPFDINVKIPVYIANFVLSTYGTGAVFGCPRHDERDYEFAQKYNLPIIRVVNDDGIMIHSQFLNGIHNFDAKKVVIQKLQEQEIGESKINYRLRDWGISRQKYWGCPIPMIHCKNCGTIPVKLADLPVKLPHDVDFSVNGNPLNHNTTWRSVKCHKCGEGAERETDTLDTFFDSSWYFAKYCTTDASLGIDKKKADFWMPVDCYVGGPEHSVTHLLYARFFTKALRDLGYWSINEPFKMMYTQGMVCNAAYKDNSGKWVESHDVTIKGSKYYRKSNGEEVTFIGAEKMSKSKLNGIEPREYIDKYGADTIRMFVLSDSPPDKNLDWNDAAVDGVYKFLQKLYRVVNTTSDYVDSYNAELEKLKNKTIASVTSNYNDLHINKVIANIRELSNALYITINKGISAQQRNDVIGIIATLLYPIIPHIAAEILQIINYNNALSWPIADAQFLVENTMTIVIQVNGKLRGTISVDVNSDQATIERMAMENHNVKNAINGCTINKIIYVKNKIINFIC